MVGHPEVVEEDRVVRAAADAHVHEVVVGDGGGVARRLPRLARPAARSASARGRPVAGSSSSRARSSSEGRQGADRLWLEVGARGRGVDVEVGDRLRPELVGELLAPLGRAGESHLLAVPGAEDEGAACGRVPVFRSSPSARVTSMSDAVPLEGSTPPNSQASRWLPEHDPLVGPLAPADPALDDVVRPHAVVHDDLHVRPHAPAPEAVLDRKPALPFLRRNGAVHVLEQRLRVLPRERRDRRSSGATAPPPG